MLSANAVARRHDDAGRPDLDVELVDLSGRERLLLVVRMVRPVGQRARRIELAVRRAQPALRDRRARIERALEDDFLPGGSNTRRIDEQVGVGRCRGEERLQRHRPGDLGRLRERRRGEREAVAQRVVGERRRLRRRRGGETHALGVEVEARPLGARERPFVFLARHELLAGVAHLQQHLRLLSQPLSMPLRKWSKNLRCRPTP